MDKQDFKKKFDPNATGNTTNNIFGLPFDVHDSRLVFIPIPWDVTVSNHQGTAEGPGNIFGNSFQIDLYDPLAPNAWKKGMAMEKIDPRTITNNRIARQHAEKIILHLEAGGVPENLPGIEEALNYVNQACENLCQELEIKSLQYLENQQIPLVIGGDHSTPLGLIRALAKQGEFGILQIDAHADMRDQYQGFSHSHASIMRNALNTEGVVQLTQVGIRELCPEEVQFISRHPRKIMTFFDHNIHQRMFEGETWSEICQDIVSRLPKRVYISFDVDGLDPSLCPGTGTPVPGGLTFNQAIYLLETLVKEGKQLVGADLVETGSTPLDGIVASRILYRMAGMVIHSNE